MKKIELNDFSKYRNELMGICALGVIMCHSLQHCTFPFIVTKLLSLGTQCVDIFLFLGGLGMYYSLNKPTLSIIKWYKTRLIRVVLPYLVAAIPFYIWFTVYNGEEIGNFILYVSSISFWTKHIGMWYVDLLIPLYLLTPLFAKLIDGVEKRWIPTTVLVAFFIFLSIPIYNDRIDNSTLCDVITNFQFVMCRIPLYILGYYSGYYVKKGEKVRSSFLIILLLIFAGNILVSHIFSGIYIYIPFSIFLLFSFCIILRFLNNKGISINILKKCGELSLELYLANCVLVPLLFSFEYKVGNVDLSYGNYFYYLLVVIMNFPLAFVIHIISEKIKGGSK